MTDMPRMTLLPVGNPDRRALDDLARDLGGMGFDVELAGRRALPQGAFDARRGHFHAPANLVSGGILRSLTTIPASGKRSSLRRVQSSHRHPDGPSGSANHRPRSARNESRPYAAFNGAEFRRLRPRRSQKSTKSWYLRNDTDSRVEFSAASTLPVLRLTGHLSP